MVNREATKYRRAALERYEDAETLLARGRWTGAVYLGGYAVECIWKALILSRMPSSGVADQLREFRGAGAHNFDRLRSLFHRRTGEAVPSAIAKQFSLVATWTTELRYDPKVTRREEAVRFLEAVSVIRIWAERRMGA